MHDIALLNGIVIEPSDIKPQGPYNKISEKKVHGGSDLSAVLNQAKDTWQATKKAQAKSPFSLMSLKAFVPQPKQSKNTPSIDFDALIPSESLNLASLEFSSDYEIPSEPHVMEVPPPAEPIDIAPSANKKSSVQDLGEEHGVQKLANVQDDAPMGAAQKDVDVGKTANRRSDTRLLPMAEYSVLGALNFHKEEGEDELQLPAMDDSTAPAPHMYWSVAADRLHQAMQGDNAWRKDIQHRFLSTLGDNKLVGKRLAPHTYAPSTFEAAVTWQMQAHKVRLEGLGWVFGATLGQLDHWLKARVQAPEAPEGEERSALKRLSKELHLAGLKVGDEGRMWNQLKEDGFPMYRQVAQWMPNGWRCDMGLANYVDQGVAEKRQMVTEFRVKDIFSPGDLSLRVYSKPSLLALARMADAFYAVDQHFGGNSLALDAREDLVHYGNRVDSVLKWPTGLLDRESRQMRIPPGEHSGAAALKKHGYEPKYYYVASPANGEFRYYKAAKKPHQK